MAEMVGMTGSDVSLADFSKPVPVLAGFWVWDGLGTLIKTDTTVLCIAAGKWRRAAEQEVYTYLYDTYKRDFNATKSM